MRDWLLKVMASICASAPLLVLLLMSLVMVGTDASVSRSDRAPAETGGQPAADAARLPDTLTRWLEQAATAYQSDVARKLSVPRQAGLVATVSPVAATTTGSSITLTAAVDAVFQYIAFWIEQAYGLIGNAPSEVAHAHVALLADQTARDARSFVEARKKAEAEWNEAVERANAAAADAARQESERKSAAEKDAAEAERRRAEARKEELRKIKEDLDRRIEEGLKKLEELEKLDPTKKTEATRKALVADVARGASESLKAVADARRASAARKAAAEKQVAEAKAAYVREVAEAEQARKTAEAERVRSGEETQKAGDARRLTAAATDRKRLDAEQAGKAVAERKAQAEARAAEEARIAEAKADYARRVAAAEADRKRLDAEQARKAEEERRAAQEAKAGEGARQSAPARHTAEAKAGETRKSTEEKAAREADMRRAEVKAIEERRQAAAVAETERKAEEARKVKEARSVSKAREAEDARRIAEAERLAESRSSTEVAPSDGDDKIAAAAPESKPVPRAGTTEPPGERSVAPRQEHVQTSRASAKAHVVKSRRHAAKARHRHRKAARLRHARMHVVRRGETLWSISRRYLGDGTRYRVIYRANRGKIRNPHRICPGQRLRLP